MPRLSIHFFAEDIAYTLKKKLLVRKWISNSVHAEGFSVGELNFIFCTDAYLLGINQQFLNHDTLTDIITFDNSEVAGVASGDIYISVERTRENALKFNVTETAELHRVMIHGILHLIGYADKGSGNKKKMTLKEDHYLALLEF